ncbi:MAG TPA: hypothetical protein VFW76_04110 [Ktedonobacterales bacterium]|nr:hypothetical protein [Ktedonobacterales bacterium]
MKRPRGVIIIGCLLLLQGLVLSAFVAVLAATTIPALRHELPPDLVISLDGVSPQSWASVGANAVVAILSLVGGVALLLVRPWAWTLALLVQGYSLAVDLWGVLQGRTPYLEMLVPIVIIFYLNTRSVTRFFETLRHRTSVRPHTAPVALNASAGTMAPEGQAIVPTLTPTIERTQLNQPDQQPVRHESVRRS